MQMENLLFFKDILFLYLYGNVSLYFPLIL